MSSQSNRAVGFLWSVVAMTLIALCAQPAYAGHSGHRSSRMGGNQRLNKKHGKPVRAPSAPPRSR